MYKHILVPIDGSACAQQGVRHGVRLAKSARARLLFACVIPRVPTPVAALGRASLAASANRLRATLRQDAQAAMDQALRAAARAGLQAKGQILGPAAPAAAIIDLAKRKPCDLIVMGSHGRRGFRRLVIGSVTESVLRDAGTPVLVVRCSRTTGHR